MWGILSVHDVVKKIGLRKNYVKDILDWLLNCLFYYFTVFRHNLINNNNMVVVVGESSNYNRKTGCILENWLNHCIHHLDTCFCRMFRILEDSEHLFVPIV